MKKRIELKVGDALRITYHPKGQKAQRILTTVVATVDGHDLVVVDKQGCLYTTWWTEKAEYLQYYHPIYRRWRRYDLGIFSLKRSLLYAMLEAQEIKIPSIGQLQTFCRNRRAEISLYEGNIAEKLYQISGQFKELQDFLKNRKRQNFRHSKEQLNFFLLIRDSLGRINIGVLQARLTAIDFRFTKELENLCGWMPHYAGRLQTVRQMQQQFSQNIRDAKRRLGAMMTHEAIIRNFTSEKQIKAIKDIIESIILVMNQLKAIRPFCRWAKYCLFDLGCALKAIDQNDFIEAKEILKRLLESFKLREYGFELEKLIEEISLDMLSGKINAKRQEYYNRLYRLAIKITEINEANFTEPCKIIVLEYLKQGRLNLIDGKPDKSKADLKQASSAI